MALATTKMIMEKEGGIGWMVFNNPERRNALSSEMMDAVGEIMRDFRDDPAIRVVVMRGAGDKAFVSGADISEFEAKRSNAAAVRESNARSDKAREEIAGLGKPLIAMINGFCIGGGLAMALTADIRISADNGQFGVPAARLGVAYGFPGLKLLTELVGPAKAKEILFTAKRYTAAEAERMGLVNQVVAADALESTVRDLARTIGENAPLSIKAAKATIEAVCQVPSVDLREVERLFDACFDSQDYAEGRRAFMEKRRPAFSGR